MVSHDQLYSEHVNGRLVSIGKARPSLLVMGSGKLPAGTKAAFRGEIILRYAYPLLLTKDVIYPSLVIDDFRRQHTGWAAIAFMEDKGNSYPRADVVGLVQSTQARADLFMKEVDIADGLRVYAFSPDSPAVPLARVGTAVWLDPRVGNVEMVSQALHTEKSFLPDAARCYRCAAAALPELFERVSLSASS